MNAKKTKHEALKEAKAWNPQAELVKADIFHSHPFFDPEDRVQVKYEMIRAREIERVPLKEACAQFGFTRESYRHILERFRSEGIGGLFELKRGRKGPIKAKESVREFVCEEHARNKSLPAEDLAHRCYHEFGVTISRRTVFRILQKRIGNKKNP
jgi:transposase